MKEYNYLNKISYKLPEDSEIVGIGTHSYDRLGPEHVLDNYSIISIKDSEWNKSIKKVKIHSLSSQKEHIKLKKNNTSNMVINPSFKRIIENFNNPYFLTYKPNKSIEEFFEKSNLNLLSNDPEYSQIIENKVEVRKLLSNKVNFPKFMFFDVPEIPEFKLIEKEIGTKFVIQDQKLSGGKGTFIIKNEDDYNKAVDKLKKMDRKKGVISEFIEGKSASIQCCTTKYGSFFAGIQEQIISEPSLLNPQINGKGTFAGGAWGGIEVSESILNKINNISKEIGNEFYKNGFRGIFAPDLIITKDDVYLIEVNARISGMTPFISMYQNLENRIPYILLHILELGNFDYKINDILELEEEHKSDKTGTYMILHNKKNEDIAIKETFRSGIYNYDSEGNISFSHEGYNLSDLNSRNQIIITGMTDSGSKKGSGKRLGRIISKKYHFHDQKLDKTIQNIIQEIEKDLY